MAGAIVLLGIWRVVDVSGRAAASGDATDPSSGPYTIRTADEVRRNLVRAEPMPVRSFIRVVRETELSVPVTSL